MFDRASGDRPEDFASDVEVAMYWLSYCRDAVGRAQDKAAAKRLPWQTRRIVR